MAQDTALSPVQCPQMSMKGMAYMCAIYMLYAWQGNTASDTGQPEPKLFITPVCHCSAGSQVLGSCATGSDANAANKCQLNSMQALLHYILRPTPPPPPPLNMLPTKSPNPLQPSKTINSKTPAGHITFEMRLAEGQSLPKEISNTSVDTRWNDTFRLLPHRLHRLFGNCMQK